MPTLSAEPPEGHGWIHEIKHDGFRTLLRIDQSDVRAFTRGGHDWTDKYARVIGACRKLKCRSALIDGEIIVQDKNGLSDFAALRAAIESSPHRLVMFAFDLLWLDGEDLRRLPLMERRDKLQRLLPKDQRCAIQYSEHWDGSGAALFKKACDMGLEGIVSKRALSAYKGGPSKFWLGRARDFEARAAWPMMHISRGSRPCSILTSPAVLAGFSISFGIYLMNEGPGGSSRNTH